MGTFLHNMRASRALLLCSGLAAVVASTQVAAARSQADGLYEPDINAPIAEVASGILGVSQGTPNRVTPPAGTNVYHSSASCVTLTGSSTSWTDVFGSSFGNLQFYTGAASSLAEIQFSSQASLGTGPVENRIDFKCSISQDDGSTWSDCSGQNATNGVILARNVKDVNGSSTTYQTVTNSGVYMGTADVSPGTLTQVRLQVRNRAAGNTSSTVCWPSVIVRF